MYMLITICACDYSELQSKIREQRQLMHRV